MKKWIIGCGVTLLLALIAAGGLGYLGYAKLRDWNANRKAEVRARQILAESGLAQRQKYLETHLAQEIRDTIPADFYTYDGFRDWWRMPLVFPYQLMCIDSRDRAYLETYDPKYPVSDPNKSSSGVFGKITHIATDNEILLFERQSDSGSFYGMLRYASGKQSEFGKEDQLWVTAVEAGYSGSKKLTY